MPTTRIRIFHPTDPLGPGGSGTDTFIRRLLAHAPDDLRFSLVGVTGDAVARPVGRFQVHRIGRREFDFFPVMAARAPTAAGAPVSIRYTLAAARYRVEVSRDFEVFDFHDLAPSLLFAGDSRPRNAFFHRDPKGPRVGPDESGGAPSLADDGLDAKLVPLLQSGFGLRQGTLTTLARRYPDVTDRFALASPCVDTRVFFPAEAAVRSAERERLGRALSLDRQARRIVTVGRLEPRKDLATLIDAIGLLVRDGRKVVLLIVGEGPMRPMLEERVSTLDLDRQVRFLGLRNEDEVAGILRGSDMFALSSRDEGLPMALLEALACGLPAASTEVGEIRRVLRPGRNGAIARQPRLAAYADALANVLDHLGTYGGAAAWDAVQPFRAETALQPVYDNYRLLASARGQAARALAPSSARAVSEAWLGTYIEVTRAFDEDFAETVPAVLEPSLRR